MYCIDYFMTAVGSTAAGALAVEFSEEEEEEEEEETAFATNECIRNLIPPVNRHVSTDVPSQLIIAKNLLCLSIQGTHPYTPGELTRGTPPLDAARRRSEENHPVSSHAPKP